MTAKKTSRSTTGKRGAGKLTLKKETLRDLDAGGESKGVKAGGPSH